MNIYLTKGDIHMANKHMKRYSRSYIIKEFTLNNKTLMHTCETGPKLKHWQPQMLVRTWATGIRLCCWWEGKMVPQLWKSLATSYKNKHTLTIWSNFTFLGIYPKKLKTCTHQNLHTDVSSSLIYNLPNLKVTKTFFNRWT